MDVGSANADAQGNRKKRNIGDDKSIQIGEDTHPEYLTMSIVLMKQVSSLSQQARKVVNIVLKFYRVASSIGFIVNGHRAVEKYIAKAQNLQLTRGDEDTNANQPWQSSIVGSSCARKCWRSRGKRGKPN